MISGVVIGFAICISFALGVRMANRTRKQLTAPVLAPSQPEKDDTLEAVRALIMQNTEQFEVKDNILQSKTLGLAIGMAGENMWCIWSGEGAARDYSRTMRAETAVLYAHEARPLGQSIRGVYRAALTQIFLRQQEKQLDRKIDDLSPQLANRSVH